MNVYKTWPIIPSKPNFYFGVTKKSFPKPCSSVNRSSNDRASTALVPNRIIRHTVLNSPLYSWQIQPDFNLTAKSGNFDKMRCTRIVLAVQLNRSKAVTSSENTTYACRACFTCFTGYHFRDDFSALATFHDAGAKMNSQEFLCHVQNLGLCKQKQIITSKLLNFTQQPKNTAKARLPVGRFNS